MYLMSSEVTVGGECISTDITYIFLHLAWKKFNQETNKANVYENVPGTMNLEV